MTIFYLGTHKPQWLGRTDVPLFVSRRRLAERKSLPRALGPWALDSGAFTEISMHGKWTLSAKDYVAEVRRFRDEVGNMQWAAIQDWMCEPFITAKTGLDIAEHQKRTVDNYAELLALAPEIPWTPVLQGWGLGDYLSHVEQYAAAGFNLARLKVVGLGSVCRRQGMTLATRIVRTLASAGLRLHGFGFKLTGLEQVGDALASADSMAWSLAARRKAPMPGCDHASCANCMKFALAWRERVMSILARHDVQSMRQMPLFEVAS